MPKITKLILTAFLLLGHTCLFGQAPVIRVMSYNILHGTDATGKKTLQAQGAAIAAAKPDLVGLQEVDNQCTRSASVDEMKELARLTGMHPAFGPHFEFQGGQYGLGLLSRWPLTQVRTDRISLFTDKGTTETRALLSAVATLDDGTTVIMATVHMGLNQQSRIAQAHEIVQHLSGRGGPVILTGDFNAEPGTPELKILEQEFQNVGSPGELTFAVGNLTKTIDYILVSRPDFVGAEDYRVLKDVPFSDHYPIAATVKLRGR